MWRKMRECENSREEWERSNETFLGEGSEDGGGSWRGLHAAADSVTSLNITADHPELSRGGRHFWLFLLSFEEDSQGQRTFFFFPNAQKSVCPWNSIWKVEMIKKPLWLSHNGLRCRAGNEQPLSNWERAVCSQPLINIRMDGYEVTTH